MNLYDMNKVLCDELCCEFEKFEHDRSEENFHHVYKLIKAIVGLQELEAAGAMRRYLEDEHGYDSYTGEFREMMYPRYGIYNAIPPMYSNPNPAYQRPITAGDRRKMDGREHGRGYDDDYDHKDGQDMNRDGYRGIYNMAHMDGMKHKEKLTPQEIQKWMDSLESESGERGPMWSKEEIEAVAKKEGIKFDEFTPEELYAVTNMMYSDYCETGEAFNIDKPAFYISLAKNFLVDPDAVGEGGEKKLAAYYEYVVEH